MLNFTREIYQDFFSFLKNPTEQAALIQTRSEKAKKIFTLLMIDIPVMGVLIGVLSGMEALGLFDLDNNKFNFLFLTMPVYPLIIILVILIPFFEELIFRLYLRYKTNYLLRFFVFLTSIVGLQNQKKFEAYVNQFWIKRYKVIFYFSAILFGLIHITNYEISPMVLLFAPIIVAPQFVAGLLLGYMRVRHGVISGFLLHSLHNMVFICIPLLFIGNSAQNLNIETNDYTIKIEKSSNMHVLNFIWFFQDSVIMNQASIKYILAEVLDKDKLLIKSNNELIMNTTINLKYKNKLINHAQYQKNIDYPLLRKNILNELKKAYGFRIKNESIEKEVWDLCLVDSGLLANHISDSIKSNRIDVFAGEVSSANTNMYHLSKSLSQVCGKYIVNRTGTRKKYAISLQTNDFDALQNQLITEYGLTLKQTTKELEFTTIEF